MTILRNCGAGDYAGVVEIYNHYILHSHATFDLHTFSVGERVTWFSQFADSGPLQLLVAERDGHIVGYCSSTRLRDRPAYDISVETTIYIAPAEMRSGTGSALYGELISRLRDEGIHGAYAAIALPNEASIRLHENLGYNYAGTYHEVGKKFGRLIDVSWYEKRLQDSGHVPAG